MIEGDIQRQIMLGIQQEWPTALIKRQNTGAGKDHAGNFVRFGVPGQGDLACVIFGLAVEVEVKTPTGRQSKVQKNYQAALERAGGIYVLARSVEEALEQIREKLDGKHK